MDNQKVEITQQMINDARQQERKLISLKKNQFKKLIEIYMNRVAQQLLLDLNYLNTQQAIDDYMLVIRWIYNYEKRNPLIKGKSIKRVKQVDNEAYNINFDTGTIPTDLEIDSETIEKQEALILFLFGSFIKIHNERADIQFNRISDEFIREIKSEETTILSDEMLMNLNKEDITAKFEEYQSKKESSNFIAIISIFAYMKVPRGIWVTMGDSLVRSSHRKNHGEIRKKGIKFPNGQYYPRDLRAKIEEWINCRCILLDATLYNY